MLLTSPLINIPLINIGKVEKIVFLLPCHLAGCHDHSLNSLNS